MAESNSRRVLITQSDLATCAEVVNARFRNPEAEADRLRAIRHLLKATFQVEQAIRTQSRCALVNHSGTRGTNNLADATDALFEAMYQYASMIREIGAEFNIEHALGSRIHELEVV